MRRLRPWVGISLLVLCAVVHQCSAGGPTAEQFAKGTDALEKERELCVPRVLATGPL